MRKLMLVALVMFEMMATVRAYDIEGNPDRRISFGLNYDHTGQNSEYSFRAFNQNDFTKVNQNSIIADVKIPISSFFTFQIRGGYLNTVNDIFTGEKIEYSGYDIGAGVRVYLP